VNGAALATLLLLQAASATPPTARTSTPALALTPPETTEAFSWPERYPRVRVVEYVATGLLVTGNALADVIFTGVDTEVWHGGVLFDDAIRDSYRNVPNGPRETLRSIGDYSLLGLVLFPFVVDSVGTALIARGSLDAAWQTSIISMQSLLLSSLMNLLAKRYITRNRPGLPACEADCQRPGYRSFYSGHTTQTFTGAGLICAHHAYLDLWGGGLADDLACAGALSLGVLTGISRILSDSHHTTDVLVGAAVGLAVGFVLPSWLHYDLGASDASPSAVSARLVPQVDADGGGLFVRGRF